MQSKLSSDFRLYSSMSYPVGIKYVLDCLKYVAELSMGKITYEEFLNTPKKRFKDYIVSKHNVINVPLRSNPTVISAWLWSPLQISSWKYKKFITKPTTLEGCSWGIARRWWLLKMRRGKLDRANFPLWSNCKRTFPTSVLTGRMQGTSLWMNKIDLSMSTISPNNMTYEQIVIPHAFLKKYFQHSILNFIAIATIEKQKR